MKSPLIKVIVKSYGILNEVLDSAGYFIKEGSTVLELIHMINSGLEGDKFLYAVLDETGKKLQPCTHFFLNDKNISTMDSLDTKLKNSDEIFILRADIIGG